jgi:hypothetical protein
MVEKRCEILRIGKIARGGGIPDNLKRKDQYGTMGSPDGTS